LLDDTYFVNITDMPLSSTPLLDQFLKNPLAPIVTVKLLPIMLASVMFQLTQHKMCQC